MHRKLPALLIALCLFGPLARADDKQRCIEASEQAQKLKDEHKLSKAREFFLSCTREGCPGPIVRACTEDLADVERRQPTLVFQARDPDGRDLVGVKVSVDGEERVSSLDGRAIPIDPGVHAVHFDAEGFEPSEQQVVVAEGEKQRIVRANLRKRGSPKEELKREETSKAQGGPPLVGWILAGAGVLSLGAGVGFGLGAQSDIDGLKSSCSPRCSPSDVDPVRTKLLASDILVGVGVVSLAAGAYFLLFTKAKAPAKPAALAPRGLTFQF